MIDDELELEQAWNILVEKMEKLTGKKADINSMLFLIGVQELGKGPQRFSKEQKQDLMHIAICKILSFSDYYELEGIDQEGWPHWKEIKKLPFLDILSQEKLLKMHILEYFEHEVDGIS